MNGESNQPLDVAGRTIAPGEKRKFRFESLVTYHGDSVEIPVTVINGEHPGPTVFLTAAVHGDELNGINVVREVAARYAPADLHGALVCLHVLNVPGFLAQQRYVPIDNEDLNRSFPGDPTGTTSRRLANTIYETFISDCDLGLDLHTSTRGRTTMYHVRADMQDPAVERVARSVGTSVILDGEGTEGTLRKAASAEGIPTVTIEMGRAHRFETSHLDRGLHCVANVLAEHDVLVDRPVAWPGWTRVVAPSDEKTWLRAETGGLVEMQWGTHPLVEEGSVLFTIADHFKEDVEVVRAPYTGLVVGALESPVAFPGHPLCHFVRVDEQTAEIIREDIERRRFDVYLQGGFQWPEPQSSTHDAEPGSTTTVEDDLVE